MSLVFLRLANTASVRAVVCALEQNHAIQACKSCAVTLVAVLVELLLGDHISAGLQTGKSLVHGHVVGGRILTSHEKETIA